MWFQVETKDKVCNYFLCLSEWHYIITSSSIVTILRATHWLTTTSCWQTERFNQTKNVRIFLTEQYIYLSLLKCPILVVTNPYIIYVLSVYLEKNWTDLIYFVLQLLGYYEERFHKLDTSWRQNGFGCRPFPIM